MIETYAQLGMWLLENGFEGKQETFSDGIVFKNYTSDCFSCKAGQYRIEKSVNKGRALSYSIDGVEILSYEKTKLYLMKELGMNDVTPEELETKPLKSVEPDHLELFKKQMDHAEGIIYELVDNNGLDINRHFDDFFSLRDSLLNQESDFEGTIADETYRFIHEDKIEGIFKESAVELAKDCNHDHLENMPSLLASNIDWEAVAEEMRHDGYGQHFATYDGEENYKNNYYYFHVG